jgi:hypothetical protein
MSPADIISSLSPPWCRLSSDRRLHVDAPCHASFLWSQDERATSTSSSSKASSHRLLSRAETKALNLYHRQWPPSPDHPTPTLHCYKKVISTLSTLPTTQSHLYFVSSLAIAPRHRKSTHRCHSCRCHPMLIIPPHNDIHGNELADPLSFPK